MKIMIYNFFIVYTEHVPSNEGVHVLSLWFVRKGNAQRWTIHGYLLNSLNYIYVYKLTELTSMSKNRSVKYVDVSI